MILRGFIAAKLLGFDDYIPPFSSTRGQQLLTGANFASAAAGIRDETGQQLVTIYISICTTSSDTYIICPYDHYSTGKLFNLHYIIVNAD